MHLEHARRECRNLPVAELKTSVLPTWLCKTTALVSGNKMIPSRMFHRRVGSETTPAGRRGLIAAVRKRKGDRQRRVDREMG